MTRPKAKDQLSTGKLKICLFDFLILSLSKIILFSEEHRIPVLKRPLSDLRCCDGDSATLECRIDVTQEFQVRWEKDGKVDFNLNIKLFF